jgi:hypothetical protein
MIAAIHAGTIARGTEGQVSDTDAHLWHPWLRINRVLRAMLHTRWSAEAWSEVRVEFKRALALPSSGLATPPGIRGWASVTRSSMRSSASGASPTGSSPGPPLIPLRP